MIWKQVLVLGSWGWGGCELGMGWISHLLHEFGKMGAIWAVINQLNWGLFWQYNYTCVSLDCYVFNNPVKVLKNAVFWCIGSCWTGRIVFRTADKWDGWVAMSCGIVVHYHYKLVPLQMTKNQSLKSNSISYRKHQQSQILPLFTIDSIVGQIAIAISASSILLYQQH